MAADGEEQRSTRPLPRTVLVLLTLLVVVIAGGVIWALPHAQDDLTARSQLALDAAGFDDVVVDVAGRDVTVAGAVANDAGVQQVEDLLYGLRGVRRVDATRVASVAAAASGNGEATDAATEPAAPSVEAAGVTLTVDEAAVTVAGAVPSQQVVDTIVTATAAAFSDKDVATNVVVSANVAEAGWLADLDGIVRGLVGLQGGIVAISDEGVAISGFAGDSAGADAIVAAVVPATALSVSAEGLHGLGPPAFSAVAESGAVTLSGALPTAADVETVVGAAEEHFTTVNSTLEAGGVRRPLWIDGLPGLFDLTSEWRSWHLELGEDGGTFSGLAPGAADIETLQPRLVGQLGVEDLAYGVEIEPDLVATAVTQLLEGSTTFPTGSTDLSDEATALLDEVIVILDANPSTRLTVEGHTDDQGSAAGNLLLSQDRAQAVVDYLVQGGITSDRLTPVGYGEERPIADNSTNDGRRQNRRIAFVVEPRGSG